MNLVVDKGASNTQSLGNANTYTGNTFIRSGVLNIARGGNLPATTVVTTGSTQNLFGLRKIGSGTFEPSGAIVNYSGGTVIEGGVFRISSDSKLGQIGSLTGTAGSPGSPQAPISAFASSLVLNGGALQVTTSTNFVLDSKRGIGLGPTSGTSGGTGTLVVDPAITLTYAGIIATAGNTGTQLLIKEGLGELALDGDAYVFATYGSLTGTFESITNLPAGYAVDYSYPGNSMALVAVPEPSTYAMALAGLACGVCSMFRRRKRS